MCLCWGQIAVQREALNVVAYSRNFIADKSGEIEYGEVFDTEDDFLWKSAFIVLSDSAMHDFTNASGACYYL